VTCLDTTFLIDLQREMEAGRPGRAAQWIRDNGEGEAGISAVAWGEFLEGLRDRSHPILTELAGRFLVWPVGEEAAEIYGRVVRGLRSQGRLVGSNDLWIACTALSHGAALLTRNVEEMARVPGLRVMGY
jgi:tRNA(fMet)-specific endonuclease VapC